MANKNYVNVSGTWREVKKKYINVSGTWREIKKEYVNVGGAWRLEHNPVVEYTFTYSINSTSGTGSPLIAYVDPNSADEFIITINGGVVLRGQAGGNGATGATGNANKVTNCHDTSYGNGGNGGNGGTGGYALDLSGFSGKTVTIYNNGAIIGGTGGAGGAGGGCNTYGSIANCGDVRYGGCGGAGGAGGGWVYASAGVSLSVQGNSPSNGASGGAGAHGSPTGLTAPCNNCFLPEAQVMMADSSLKALKDVKVGDYVLDMFNEPQEVLYLDHNTVINQEVYSIDGLITTDNHMIVRGDKKGFAVINPTKALADTQQVFNVLDKEGLLYPYTYMGINPSVTPVDELKGGTPILTISGPRVTQQVTKSKERVTGEMMSLVVGGSHTFSVDGVFVSGFATDIDYDYKKGEIK